jgi:hypothetical protein
VEVKDTDLKVPAKGKKTTVADLKKTLASSLKDWGNYGVQYTWFLMI